MIYLGILPLSKIKAGETEGMMDDISKLSPAEREALFMERMSKLP
jgi:hypothetical protein